ncbi:MAG: hypothetical protein ACON4U_03370, partial [Myxococcota bacterium]
EADAKAKAEADAKAKAEADAKAKADAEAKAKAEADAKTAENASNSADSGATFTFSASGIIPSECPSCGDSSHNNWVRDGQDFVCGSCNEPYA